LICRRVIDWLTCKVPCRLPAPWVDGSTVKLDREGKVLLQTHHRVAVPGSHEASILVRAVSPQELEISGNLAKWLQGHNLYGPDCPRELLAVALARLAAIRGVDAAECFPAALQGSARLSRIDCTYMAMLPDPGSVRTWLRDAYATGSATHRGRGVFENGTLVFGHARGKSFQHWQLVCYAKGDEIRRHDLPGAMTADDAVLPWADRMLRLEVRLGRLLLERAGLSTLSNWTEGAGRAQWDSAMAKLEFSEVETDAAVVGSLPRALRAAFLLWKNGDDLREIYSPRSFYRLRSGLRASLGIDIATPPLSGPASNIVPIRRRLEAVLVGRPEWADRVDLELAGQGCFVFPNAA
jgi:II/X family phage/plasmid replication protein